jgi:epsin
MSMLQSTPAVASPTTSSFAQQPAYNYNMGNNTMGGMQRTNTSMSQPISPASTGMQRPQSFFGGAPMQPTSTGSSSNYSSGPVRSSTIGSSTPTTAKSAGGFEDLWSMSLGNSSTKPATGSTGNKSMKDLEKEKSNAGLWGGAGGKPQTPQQNAFGSFGNAAPASSSGGGDDLLL